MVRILAIAFVLSACAGAERVEVEAGAGSPAELGSTLDVRVLGDTVRFALHVTNVTNAALTLEFSSAQRHDFVVTEPGGDEVWRWSGDRMFAQMMSEEVLRAGESRMYEAAWVARVARGKYVATGHLTSLNYPVELRTVFEAPGSDIE